MQTVLTLILSPAQEGAADVSESELAVSLFCSSVPGSPALPRRSLARRWRFFFLFFVFPESEAPTGGSSPGQLQMRNSWPAALAAAQIRPFEKITVLLLPPPPVGHARSAEGRGMCRRAGGGRERGATFHSTSFRKFFSLLFFSLSSSNVSI